MSLDLYPDTDFRGMPYAPLGEVALLVAFDDKARSCKSRGFSDLWSEPDFEGIHLGLIGDRQIPWLGDHDLDMSVSSTKTSAD